MDEINPGKRRSAASKEKNNPLYHERHHESVEAAARVFLRKAYEKTQPSSPSPRKRLS